LRKPSAEGYKDFTLDIDHESANWLNPHPDVVLAQPVAELLDSREGASDLRHGGLRQLEIGLITSQPIDETEGKKVRIRPPFHPCA
jgi:hypothetical protein